MKAREAGRTVEQVTDEMNKDFSRLESTLQFKFEVQYLQLTSRLFHPKSDSASQWHECEKIWSPEVKQLKEQFGEGWVHELGKKRCGPVMSLYPHFKSKFMKIFVNSRLTDLYSVKYFFDLWFDKMRNETGGISIPVQLGIPCVSYL